MYILSVNFYQCLLFSESRTDTVDIYTRFCTFCVVSGMLKMLFVTVIKFWFGVLLLVTAMECCTISPESELLESVLCYRISAMAIGNSET
jgi:hypothetical protein